MRRLTELELTDYRQLLNKPHLALVIGPLLSHIDCLAQELAAEKEKLQKALSTLETNGMLEKIDTCRQGLS